MGSDVERLNDAFARPGTVAFRDHPLGGIAADLITPHAGASVALHGAHVLSYRPRAGTDVLWMSPTARIAEGHGIRGGIPVCWPWFAQHPVDPHKPDHGFVRKTAWRVVRTMASSDGAQIELAIATGGRWASLWQGEADLTATVTLSHELRVDLETRNTGTRPFELTQALHSYFAVGNIADTQVRGLDGCTYLDKLQDNAGRVQQGAIAFSGEVDRIYQHAPGDVVIADSGHRRAIRIAKKGSTSTVVWNPWVEKSKRLSDMPPEAFVNMVCVETTNAGGDVVTLIPRATHRLSTIISVEPL